MGLKKFKYYFITILLVVFYNNCSPGYHSLTSSMPSTISVEELPTHQQDVFEGKALYAKNCSSCHGPIETSQKRNITLERLTLALKNQPNMKFLNTLSTEELYQIVVALSEDEVDEESLACENSPDVGSVAMHRLNFFEYKNTVASLTGVTLPEDSTYPTDRAGEFPNEAAKLMVDEIRLSWYLDSSLSVVSQLMADSQLRSAHVSCNLGSSSCRKITIESFASKAFRRPVKATESAALIALANQQISSGSSVDEAIETVFASILVSPSFLYRNTELQNPTQGNLQEKLDPYELASRVSYFIWGDSPDSTLIQKILNNEFTTETQVRSEIQRMLADPRASTHLSKNFLKYWMGLQQFQSRTPNTNMFPQFTNSIRRDMEKETELFFQDIVSNNHTLADFLTLPTTYLNKNLADYYGIQGSFNSTFKKVDLSGTGRIGIITQGSLLTNTSHSSGTSIVRRGSFVALNLQCIEIQPPVDISPLPSAENGESIRERLEAHRSNPQCTSCHTVLDPPGFGLESFSAVGQVRSLDDDGFPLDTTGTLYTGSTFSSAEELAGLLAHERTYERCAIKKLLSFSVGRTLESVDQCTVEKIVNRAGDASLRDIIVEIVMSDIFQYERGD